MAGDAFGKNSITVEETRALVQASVRLRSLEEVDLGDALGRVTAQPITSRVTSPPFDVSAMDGYAGSVCGCIRRYRSERVIQQLLAEAGKADVARGIIDLKADGVQAAADMAEVQSPETYVGYARAENFLPAGGLAKDAAHDYQLQKTSLNQWGLTGNWTVGDEMAVSNSSDGGIYYTFHARDLHLVLGPGADGKPVGFQVIIDGKAPGESHGTDTDAEGKRTITCQRLYQFVRQQGPVADHTFQIKSLDPGVQAYAFTFG